MITALLAIAFSAGILSFLSPCIIPMLGVYFSLIAGLSVSELNSAVLDKHLRRRVLRNTIAFVDGFTIVFIVAGSVAGEVGALLGRWTPVLNILGGTIILILALKMLGAFELPFLNKMQWEPTFFDKVRTQATGSAWISFIVGLFFAVVCSHCIAPTLYSILAAAGVTQSPLSGMTVMLVFSLGLAIPYLLTGLFFNEALKTLKRFRSKLVMVERLLGVLMLLMADIVYTNKLTLLAGYLARYLPHLPLGM